MGTFRYSPEMVDCRYCTEYMKKRHSCKQKYCPWIEERIEAGTIGYLEVIKESRLMEPVIQPRVEILVEQFPHSFWTDDKHYQRMNYLKSLHRFSKQRNTPTWYAALYLFSSNSELCGRIMNCIKCDGIDFSYARLRNITVSDYAIFMAAKTIYTGDAKITIEDMADQEMVDNDAFRLIINAQLISRYGLPVLEIKEKRIQERGAP